MFTVIYLARGFCAFHFSCSAQNVEKFALVMDLTSSLATPAGLPKYGATFEKEIW